MKQLRVDLPGREYDIVIQRGLLDQAGERIRAVCPKATRAFVATDKNVAPLYLERVQRSLEAAGLQVAFRVNPAGEQFKTAAWLAGLWEDLMEFGLTRSDVVVALGGGVVGDLAGFAAATALRGVDFIQIPTTLLAQVDSSVGGKVAVDLPAGKNLIGAFHQPRLVLMDPEVLNTLTDEIFADGMAEVIKYGCIFDADFFDFLEANASREEIMGHIEDVLHHCCDLKRAVVMEDERDTGIRMLLNFGHTLGHAYELAGQYRRWTHGQAVAAGMVKAAQMGLAMGVTPAGTAERIAALTGCFGLPAEIPCTREEHAEAIGRDKKGEGEQISLILLESMGHAAARKLPKAEVLKLL